MSALQTREGAPPPPGDYWIILAHQGISKGRDRDKKTANPILRTRCIRALAELCHCSSLVSLHLAARKNLAARCN